MKTLLSLSAAALLLSAGAATSGGAGTTVVIDGSCEIFAIEVTKNIATVREDTTFGCATKYGVGVNGSSKANRFGAAYVFAIHDADHPDTRYLYTFSSPLAGGTWAAYSTTDGESWSLTGSGTYHATH